MVHNIGKKSIKNSENYQRKSFLLLIHKTDVLLRHKTKYDMNQQKIMLIVLITRLITCFKGKNAKRIC